jgi:dTDP-4-amino-4,6-dideoxygalactose transaminase
MQSALGRVILPKVPEWLEIRQQNATYLTRRFDRIPGLRVVRPPADVRHAYYKYYTFVRPERLKPGWDRDRILIEIEKEGIPCFSGSCSEVYRERAFREAGLSPKRRLTIARMMGKTSLMFLVHPTLGLDDMEDTALAVEIVLARATW